VGAWVGDATPAFLSPIQDVLEGLG
jgi:hypothetical protein